jgi:hypothetical protein
MTTIDQTPLARLFAEGRILNPVLNGPTKKEGRYGFRGIFGLKYPPALADEVRPPEIVADQVFAASYGDNKFTFLSGYLLSFEYLSLLVDLVGDSLTPDGKYIFFANNIDLRAKYQVVINGITFYVLPIDEATVYNELLELFYLEKGDLKKLDTAGKQDAIVDAAEKWTAKFEEITFEEGVKRMGPVRNKNENRPV